MICAWQELLSILPAGIRQEVNRLGHTELLELRLRINAPPELILRTGSRWLNGRTTTDDLHFIINAASRYSPWAAASVSKGYITSSGGHRIGICGEAVCKDGRMTGVRDVHSLCIRIARDHRDLVRSQDLTDQSILILGAPGYGKTTLLRDLIRILSESRSVVVIDERGELFPSGFSRGLRTDVLRGCSKREGMDMALRTMSPDCIAVDEITEEGDCSALLQCANCGVQLLATAHGVSRQDFYTRPAYRPLAERNVIGRLWILDKHKHYVAERTGNAQ